MKMGLRSTFGTDHEIAVVGMGRTRSRGRDRERCGQKRGWCVVIYKICWAAGGGGGAGEAIGRGVYIYYL